MKGVIKVDGAALGFVSHAEMAGRSARCEAPEVGAHAPGLSPLRNWLISIPQKEVRWRIVPAHLIQESHEPAQAHEGFAASKQTYSSAHIITEAKLGDRGSEKPLSLNSNTTCWGR